MTNLPAEYHAVVDELLINIKRSCIRGRNAANHDKDAVVIDANTFLATVDHIENLADEALRYFK